LRRGFEGLLTVVGAVALVAILLGVVADARWSAAPVRAAPVAPRAEVEETERDGTLRVRVVAAGEGPLARAQVRVFWRQGDRYYDAGGGETNEAGLAVLERIPRGSVWVLADAEGRARASTQLVVEGGARDLELSLGAATKLEVLVTDEARAPLTDATVLVQSADPLPFGALTDARGVAIFDRLGAGPLSAKASAPGYESVSQSGVSGTGASLVSFWQSGLLGLKATREINWKLRRTGAARYIYNSAYKA
jgi:hypothetical protein